MIGISILCAFSSAISMEKMISDTQGPQQNTQVNNKNDIEIEVNTDYAPVPFTKLIGLSDLIVVGKVDDIAESTFKFHIVEFLQNHHDSRSIHVKKYIPAEIFAPRPAPYAKGQYFVLFLKKPEQGSSVHSWQILGYAGEGEMPVEDLLIYFEVYDLKGLEYQLDEVHGVTRNLQRYKLDDFKDAVQNYHACFSWKLVEYIKNKKKRSRWVPARICPDEAVKNYQEKGWLHEYLAQETIREIPVTN